jgi:hypothetical protein
MGDRQQARRVVVSLTAMAAALWALTSAATAKPLDLRLDRVADVRASPTDKLECTTCEKLLREVGMAMGSRMIGPAASQGPLGIEGSYELSFAQVSATESYWKRAVDKPQDTLTTGQVRVRKGLPHQTQLGTVLTYMNDSNLWAMGAELNISLIDGYRKIPDLSVRPNGQVVLGHADMTMVVTGVDAVLSKSFGIAGLFSLQPWAGYSYALTYVKANQIPVFPDAQATRPDLLTMKQITAHSHRSAVGLRVIATRVQVGAELLRSFSESLNMVTAKLGVAF